MKITTDPVSSLPSASAAATVALIRIGLLCIDGANGSEPPLDLSAASAFVTECRRVAPGPIAILAFHNADHWQEIFFAAGLTVSRGVYVHDTTDLIIGAAESIELPDPDGTGFRELIELVTTLVSAESEPILVPASEIPATGLAVQAAGRVPIIQTPGPTFVEQIRSGFEGGLRPVALDDQTYARVLERLKSGDKLSRIATDLGLWSGALSRRLALDGHWVKKSRGRTYGERASA